MTNVSFLPSVLAGAALLLGGGCTAKYQQRIMDLNEEISRLQTQVSDLRQQNSEILAKQRRLVEENRRLLEENKGLAEASARKSPSQTEAIQKEIGKGAKVSFRHGMISIGIQSTVTFAPGSTTLTSEGKRILRKVAHVVARRFPGRWIYVAGHTDNQPIRKTRKLYRSNRHLSTERADRVATYLSKCGVPSRDLVVVGYGENDPVASNSTAAGRKKNRRVEVLVGPPKK